MEGQHSPIATGEGEEEGRKCQEVGAGGEKRPRCAIKQRQSKGRKAEVEKTVVSPKKWRAPLVEDGCGRKTGSVDVQEIQSEKNDLRWFWTWNHG